METETIAIIISIVALLPLYADLLIRWFSQKVTFSLQRTEEHITSPIDSDWSIAVLHPNKPIEKCSIYCNKISLPWSDGSNIKFIDQSSGDIARIPRRVYPIGKIIVVKDGNKELRKIKFEDIPLV